MQIKQVFWELREEKVDRCPVPDFMIRSNFPDN